MGASATSAHGAGRTAASPAERHGLLTRLLCAAAGLKDDVVEGGLTADQAERARQVKAALIEAADATLTRLGTGARPAGW